MAKTVTTLKSNVGNNIQDTGTAMAALILTYLNDGYRDAQSRMNWPELIVDDYTFESVDSQAGYSLPTDFDEEIAVVNVAQGYPLMRQTIGNRWRERAEDYNADALTDGTPREYYITPENTYTGKIVLDPAPTEAETYAMPYNKKAFDLVDISGTATTNTATTLTDTAATFITSGAKAGMVVKNTTDNATAKIVTVTSETVLTLDWDAFPDGNEAYSVSLPEISGLDEFLVMYATGQGWAYKRQLHKADWYFNRAEFALTKRISRERSRANQKYQFIPSTSTTGRISRLTGDRSYDQL